MEIGGGFGRVHGPCPGGSMILLLLSATPAWTRAVGSGPSTGGADWFQFLGPNRKAVSEGPDSPPHGAPAVRRWFGEPSAWSVFPVLW